MTRAQGVVQDGQRRLVKAIKPAIREQVESEFSEQWNSAGLLRRLLLTRKIRKEIGKRMNAKVDKNSLY